MTLDSLTTTLESLALLAIMFVPLERMFAATREHGVFRAGLGTDLLFFLGQHLGFAALSVFVITTVTAPLSGGIASFAAFQQAFSTLPIWVQIPVVVAAGDFCSYWGHRLQHRVNFLWRFHAVHHSNEHVDFMAAHREHPLDGIYTQTLVNLPAIVCGFEFHYVLALVAFRSLWAILIHANVRLPLGPLRYVFGAPRLHRWHHAKSRDVGNYANLGPWLDVLFGTYYDPNHAPAALGVLDPLPKNYIGLLIHPLIPKRFVSSLRHHKTSPS